jgi:hypothetical protein
MKNIILLSLALLLAFWGCTKQTNSLTDGTTTSGKARFTIRLTDAPGLYDKVNIDVVGAEAIINDTIVSLDVNAGVYNLLDFTNGKDTVIVDQQMPSGTLSQIRLILGDNNTIEKDGVSSALTTPSAQQSGLKLNVHNTFMQGIAYEYTIDFDAAKSIVATGNGKHILKPVLKVFTKAASGSIKGVVYPASAAPMVYAILNDDSTLTVPDPATGNYMFMGLGAGTYNLAFVKSAAYRDSTLTKISVSTGLVTKIDTMKLKLK